MDERINGVEDAKHCTNCIYKSLCTPFEKLLYTKDNIKNDNITEEDEEDKKQSKEECECFIDINEFDNKLDNNNTNGEDIWQDMGGENTWKEMSWNKYTDNLFNYLEDN